MMWMKGKERGKRWEEGGLFVVVAEGADENVSKMCRRKE